MNNNRNGGDHVTNIEFPKAGVKFSYIIGEFLTSIGGRDRLVGLTTAQFCEKIIKDITFNEQSSYCSILKYQGHPAYGETAEVFISHVHGYIFLDFLSALEWHLRDEPDTIVWIDLFSINQHAPMDWTFEWLSTTFKSAVELMGRTMMVMSPWNDPLPFTRTWCVFEAYCTAVTDSKFDIAVSKADESIFLEDMEHDPIGKMYEMLKTVSSRESKCSVESDRISILSVIRETIGFERLDALVFQRYREWVIEVSLEALETCRSEQCRLKLLRSVGLLFMMQGKYDEAEPYIQDRVKRSKVTLGENHQDTLSSIHQLALIYCGQGKNVEAQSLYELCLNKQKTILGPDHNDTLHTIHDLGVACYEQGKYREAQTHLMACFERRHVIFGPSHPDTLISMKSLAELYAKQEDEDAAESMFRYCLRLHRQIQRRYTWYDEPRSLETMGALGSFFSQQKSYRDAQMMLAGCYKKMKVLLGETHPNTLKTMNNLAKLHEKLGNTEEARKLYESCFEKRKAVYGASHPKTLDSMHGLAMTMIDKNASYNMMKSCFESRKEVLGKDHPDTLESMSALAMVHAEHGKIRVARSLYSSCLVKQKSVLGENHTASITTANNIKLLKKRHSLLLHIFFKLKFSWRS